MNFLAVLHIAVGKNFNILTWAYELVIPLYSSLYLAWSVPILTGVLTIVGVSNDCPGRRLLRLIMLGCAVVAFSFAVQDMPHHFMVHDVSELPDSFVSGSVLGALILLASLVTIKACFQAGKGLMASIVGVGCLFGPFWLLFAIGICVAAFLFLCTLGPICALLLWGITVFMILSGIKSEEKDKNEEYVDESYTEKVEVPYQETVQEPYTVEERVPVEVVVEKPYVVEEEVEKRSAETHRQLKLCGDVGSMTVKVLQSPYAMTGSKYAALCSDAPGGSLIPFILKAKNSGSSWSLLPASGHDYTVFINGEPCAVIAILQGGQVISLKDEDGQFTGELSVSFKNEVQIVTKKEIRKIVKMRKETVTEYQTRSVTKYRTNTITKYRTEYVTKTGRDKK